jgi:hypothetical protein
MKIGWRWQLDVDGRRHSRHWTKDQARAAVDHVVESGDYSLWRIVRRGSARPHDFGLRGGGANTTLDLVGMGVRVHPACVNEDLI